MSNLDKQNNEKLVQNITEYLCNLADTDTRYANLLAQALQALKHKGEALSILSSAHVVDAEPVAVELLKQRPLLANCNTPGYPAWNKRVEDFLTAAPSNTATVQIDERKS